MSESQSGYDRFEFFSKIPQDAIDLGKGDVRMTFQLLFICGRAQTNGAEKSKGD